MAATREGPRPSPGEPRGVEADEPGPDEDPAWVDGVRTALLDWYEQAGRKLPWRADRDAYRILVSEFMLVQTTVAAVIPYFERFLRRFPDARSLAEADEGDVVKAWEGLGYYRRARQLQAAAQQVVRMHGGSIPDDAEAVRALPGVGPYIAGAVLSFAFDRPEPIVEANSQRVLARLVALRDDLKSTAGPPARLAGRRATGPAPRRRRFQPGPDGSRGDDLHPPTARLPALPRVGLLPGAPPGPPGRDPPDDPEAAAHGGLRGLRRGPPSGRDPDRPARDGAGSGSSSGSSRPSISPGPDPAGRSFGSPVELAEGVRRLTGITADIGPPSATIRYGVTNYRVTLEVSRGEARSGRPEPGPGLIDARWVEPQRLGEFTFSSASRRLIARIQQDPGWPDSGR